MKHDLQSLRQRVADRPDNLLAQFSFGQALFEEGLFAEAIAPLQCCAEKRGDWMLARVLLGKCYRELHQPEEARACFRQALDLAVTQHHDDPAEELRQILAEMGPPPSAKE